VQSNLDAAITVRSVETELQNTKELCATASEIAAPKPDLGARAKKDDFEALFKGILRGKSSAPKLRKSADKSLSQPVATLMLPLRYDLRCPTAKDKSITRTAAAPSNLDAAITVRSAETELQSAKELCTTTSEIEAPKPDLGV